MGCFCSAVAFSMCMRGLAAFVDLSEAALVHLAVHSGQGTTPGLTLRMHGVSAVDAISENFPFGGAHL